MPMVNVKITREGATAEQKSQVMAEMTEVLVRVRGPPICPARTEHAAASMPAVRAAGGPCA